MDLGTILGIITSGGAIWWITGAMTSRRESVDVNSFELVSRMRVEELSERTRRRMCRRLLQLMLREAEEREVEYFVYKLDEHRIKDILSKLNARQFERLRSMVDKEN